jgi:hypothetical protein
VSSEVDGDDLEARISVFWISHTSTSLIVLLPTVTFYSKSQGKSDRVQAILFLCDSERLLSI